MRQQLCNKFLIIFLWLHNFLSFQFFFNFLITSSSLSFTILISHLLNQLKFLRTICKSSFDRIFSNFNFSLLSRVGCRAESELIEMIFLNFPLDSEFSFSFRISDERREKRNWKSRRFHENLWSPSDHSPPRATTKLSNYF